MGCWPPPPTEKSRGMGKAAAWPGFQGQWLVPGGPEGWWRAGVASPQVSGRCSEATKMGPPAGPWPLGGKGLQVFE